MILNFYFLNKKIVVMFEFVFGLILYFHQRGFALSVSRLHVTLVLISRIAQTDVSEEFKKTQHTEAIVNMN